VPLATALCKTFLLRMLNDSLAGRNPTRVVVPIEEVVALIVDWDGLPVCCGVY
jgi:hypothetical protein